MSRLVLIALLLLLAAPTAASAITTRIIGGTAAVAADWPWTVAIETSYGSQFCGGTLVAPQWVLTAGHCRLYPSASLRVVAGTAVLDDGTGEILQVARQVRHPSYRQVVPGAPRDDLMLVRLASPSSAPPITLAPADSAPTTGTLLRVAGWGTTRYNPTDDSFGPESSVLRAVGVRVKSPQQCVDAYGARAFHPQDMVCASLPGQDACAGDSGGPLVDRPGPGAHLVGVVSWGTGCALARYPGVYSLVDHNRCWITSTIEPPPTPAAIALAQADGALIVDWQPARPCADASNPSSFRIAVAETGQTFDVPGGDRQYTVPGLANGTPYTISVTALNENGASAPLALAAAPAPNGVVSERAAWTGYRTARASFTLAPHATDVQWRVEAGAGLRYAARPWQTAPANGAPQVLTAELTGLPTKAIDVRIVVTDGATTTNSPRAQLVAPIKPTPIGGVRLRGTGSVGSLMRCELGRWNGTRPFAVQRQWLLAGRAITGATGQSHRILPAEDGRRLACRVTVAGPGGVAVRTTDPLLVGA